MTFMDHPTATVRAFPVALARALDELLPSRSPSRCRRRDRTLRRPTARRLQQRGLIDWSDGRRGGRSKPATAMGRIVQWLLETRGPDWWKWLVVRLVKAHLGRTDALTDDQVSLGATAADPVLITQTGGP
jgi:hypothetical protein